ncbi:small heat shock protein [Suillus fuscotomentosus]|uniref:Small heat shock protein n=1 Tax=Suillus fuscotomentosus TaxID=1912939 RepID=A0AAD4HL71_9AGAM|nr:small heat shock protein [Suillus fuscotomentosus]KAG1899534.1 small heat shock protein [Suillus fuscotomentosus]
MSLVHFHYDPFTEFERLFDDAFSARFRPTSDVSRAVESGSRVGTFRPKMDLIELEDNKVMAVFDLPGMQPENVTIDVQQNRLTISGEMSAEKDITEKDYAVRERTQGKFSRILQLPVGTEPNDVKANMENGVLKVTFPKFGKAQASQRIGIT